MCKVQNNASHHIRMLIIIVKNTISCGKWRVNGSHTPIHLRCMSTWKEAHSHGTDMKYNCQWILCGKIWKAIKHKKNIFNKLKKNHFYPLKMKCVWNSRTDDRSCHSSVQDIPKPPWRQNSYTGLEVLCAGPCYLADITLDSSSCSLCSLRIGLHAVPCTHQACSRLRALRWLFSLPEMAFPPPSSLCSNIISLWSLA